MKIDEFIEKVNQVAYAEERNYIIKVYSSKQGKNFNNWFLILNIGLQGVIANHDWDCLDDINSVDLFYILGLVQELKKTPIEERFPEKQYRLRWLKDSNGAINSLNYSDGEWSCVDIHYAKQYSEQELEKNEARKS